MAVSKKEVLECHAITGDGSHLIKVRVKDMAALEKLLSEVQSWPGVKNTKTDIVLSTAKETFEIPVDHLL
jgi:Lrp/AsnC family leucine-responsive transcriptional regulator